MSTRSGGCMCGAVRFEAEVGDRASLCFCKMCQRWSGGAFAAASAKRFEVVHGAQDVTTRRTSDWAERSFCSKCGSVLTYKGDDFEEMGVSLGALDDTDGLDVRIQFFTDKKPDGLPLAQGAKALTEAEIIKMYGEVNG